MMRLAATLVIVAALGAGLTGCSRFGHSDGPADAPAPAVSTPASGSVSPNDIADILADLDEVDATVTQVDEDGVAGDDAAHTDDTP